MPKTKDLQFTSSFTEELPADEEKSNFPRQVRNACYSFVGPHHFENPSLLITSKEMLLELQIEDAESTDFVNLFSGKKLLKNMQPYAMAYAGHQFGQWAGQLGDGRAINLGELKGKNNTWQIQLKGAGPTPYSRSADGFAVLRSSIREFLMSEAMHHLGIDTTRALSLILSGEDVLRDKLYNGNPAYEKGAVVCRVSPSFIRFGNFELLAARKDIDNLKKLTDYTIKRHYSSLENIENEKERYIAFLRSVSERTQKTIIDWMRVGFVHAVMNTDNMSILGETIDYGPYGWIDDFDRGWTPNTTDKHQKRYRFGNQIDVAQWNLMQLANALYPLINDLQPLQHILDDFGSKSKDNFYKMQFEKIGIFDEGVLQESSHSLIDTLLQLLEVTQIDMTIFYRNLADFDHVESSLLQVRASSYQKSVFDMHKEKWMAWFNAYHSLLAKQHFSTKERKGKMNAINPKYVLRNYMVQQAIEKAREKDYTLLHELHDVLKNPYAEQKDKENWFAMRPNWALDKFGCSMLSCSS